MPAYSVVVPVYNAEKYLESCVRSILNQSTAPDYEVILVDDGSRDHSGSLCDALARQDARVRVIHQPNQGVSAARNAGMDAAEGDYILFLDSDDLWPEHFLQVLEEAVMKKPDIMEFGYQKFSECGLLGTFLPDAAFSEGTGMEYFETYAQKMSMPIISCWAAAFSRQFLQKHGIRFPVGVTYGEDFQFHLQSLKYAESVVSIPQPLYLYRENEAGVTQNPTLKRARDQLASCAQMYRMIPCPLLANYYCVKILYLASLPEKDTAGLYGLLAENRDILRRVSGVKNRIAGLFYRVFGWDHGSRLLRTLINLRHSQKG